MFTDFNSVLTQFFTLTAFLVQHFYNINTFPTSNGVHRQTFRPAKTRSDVPVYANLKIPHTIYKNLSRKQLIGGKSKHHFTQTSISCNILLMRKERTELSWSCCNVLLSSDIHVEYLYNIICKVCRSYLEDIFIYNILLREICSQSGNENKNESSSQIFEIYNQKKKRKREIHSLAKRAAVHVVNTSMDSMASNKADVKNLNYTFATTEDSLHITKREVNTTDNSTVPEIPDWETLLQMQYSKDPQWALICVVFVVTLILGCVWYSRMCNEVHGEYIDPVVTHNIRPEFVRDLVLRKAKFLAWFKYLKNRKKRYQQRKISESEKLLSSTDDEDLFDQTEIY